MNQFTQYEIFNLYRNAQTPIQGTASGALCEWPGAACTASTFKLFPGWQPRIITYARWVLIWNPHTLASPTGVRLVTCDDGPSNINEIARQERSNADTPYDDAVDVTAKLSAVWNAYQAKGANGGYFQVGHQTFGNGANGPLIYGSWIEMGFAPPA